MKAHLRLIATLFGLFIISACLPAHAQVHRCKDASGRTIYSDAPCTSAQSGTMIERQKTQQEIAEERSQAAEANAQKNRQNAADLQLQIQQSAARPAPAPMATVDKSSSYECRLAQREHETVSNIRSGSQEERRNRINSATQKSNAACGLKTEMIQPPNPVVVVPGRVNMTNGKSCYRRGQMWICN